MDYFKHSHYSVTNADPTEFFSDLWGNIAPLTENIIVRSGKKKTSFLLKGAQSDYYRNKRFSQFWDNDLYFTPNTFSSCGKDCGNAMTSNMFRVISWALDIDYKKIAGNEFKDPQGYWFEYLSSAVEDGLIPCPTYIEYGHQLRLIYILDAPIGCKNGHTLIKAIKLLQDTFVKRLNDSYNCNAERQTLSSYYRVPGSVNNKDGSYVQVMKITDDRFSVQELMDDYLPRYTGKRSKPIKKHYINTSTLCKNRIHDYEILRTVKDIPREKLCFLYANTYRQLYPSQSCLSAVLKFNAGFSRPLSSKEIQSKLGAQLRSGHIYRYRNQTVLNMLGISASLCRSLKLSLFPHRSLSHHLPKIEIRRMYQNGESPIKIAEKYHISVRTVYRCLVPVIINGHYASIVARVRSLLSSAIVVGSTQHKDINVPFLSSVPVFIPATGPPL